MDLFVAAYTMVPDSFSCGYGVTIAYILTVPGVSAITGVCDI